MSDKKDWDDEDGQSADLESGEGVSETGEHGTAADSDGSVGAAAGDAKAEASPSAAPAGDATPAESVAQVAPAAPQPAPQVVAAAPRSTATPIAWLALLLVIAVAAGGFYLMMDMQRREGLLLQRVQGLESISGQDTTTFDQMRDNLRRQIELEIEGMQARQARAEEDRQRITSEQQRNLQRIEALASQSGDSLRKEFGDQIANLRSSLREQQQRINDLSVEDRESWLLAEAQYLLRLANQRLIMTGDTVSAEALLRSADNILREMDDPDLHALRAAVASDLAALRAVPRLDIQGLYLRLDALIRQTDALVMFRLPERPERETVEPAEDWKTRLVQGYELAIKKLQEYVVVSRRDAPVETLMDPQYEGLVRQNMRMLLEQAQVAMLSGNELLFRQSLERAEGWVTQFFKSDEQAAMSMAQELRLIRDERVSVDLPDLNGSLAALDAAMKVRLSRSEG